MEEDRPVDPDSREHSDGGEDTVRLSDLEEEENSCYLDIDEQLEEYKDGKKELVKLSKKSTKKGVIQFIVNQISNSSFKTKTDLDHLEKMPEKFWNVTVPVMLKDVVKEKFPKIRLLFCRKTPRESVRLTRREIYLLLCHMFFVTIPYQQPCDIPSFQYLYSSKNGSRRPEANFQKLKCIINYFEMAQSLSKQDLEEVVVCERVRQSQRHYLKQSSTLSDVEITNSEIQTFKGDIQIDFANRTLGGGVLFDGAVQEEILFVLHPELMLSKMTCRPLECNEIVVMYNVRQYSEYSGYSDSFKFKEPCKDKTSSTIVAMDAFDFRGYDPEEQYKTMHVYRQFHKSYIGFHHSSKESKALIKDQPKCKKRIITGKWGCGIFGGDSELKFIIQWLSCSLAARDMVFVNYGGTKESNELYERVIKKLKGKRTTQLKKIIEDYCVYRSDMVTKQKLIEKEMKQQQWNGTKREKSPSNSKQDLPKNKEKSKMDNSLFHFILSEWK